MGSQVLYNIHEVGLAWRQLSWPYWDVQGSGRMVEAGNQKLALFRRGAWDE